MRRKRLCNIVLACALATLAFAQTDSVLVPPPGDTTHVAHHAHEHTEQPAVYQGMTIKLDLAAAAITLATSKAQLQHYEMAMNWRLINRLYPTFEAGYAGGTRAQGDSISYKGQGGFFRVGVDLNPLKKSAADSPHALLVGVRLGTGIQQFAQALTRAEAGIADSGTGVICTTDFQANTAGVHADCWGEIVVGCQVEVARGKKPRANGQQPMAFYMGWMGRLKCLFTRNTKADSLEALTVPIYIPGFGNRDNIGWGLNYYIGWKF